MTQPPLPFEQTEIAQAAAMAVDLRDYQLAAIEGVREAIRRGAKNILLVAPTGSGKTVIGAFLVHSAMLKGKHCVFLVDRLSLIQQTSDTFDHYGIDHGVVQADHFRRRPNLQVQICSVQTVARRKWPDADLLIVDEAHTVHETTKERIEPRNTITIGLTATPFTPGLGKLYDAVVNVTTTNRLIEDGFLSNYIIYACEEPEMEGVGIVAGEFEQGETQKRVLQVVGDVVAEYLEKGEGRKFICSAWDTAHVEELQRQFIQAGINVATYTYKDRDEDRADTLLEYRKPDSTLRGLITVTAASKGFDVSDIGCVIMARPLRKSLAEYIQFFGRGLRIAPGKENCIILDHSGNSRRFWREWREFFENGFSELDDGTKKPKPKPEEKEEAAPWECPSCDAMHPPRPVCPHCGHEYPKKRAIEHVPGTLKELVATGNPDMIRKHLWPQVVGYVVSRYPMLDQVTQQKRCQGIYKELTGEIARARIEFTDPIEPTLEVRNKIKANQIRYAKGKQKARELEQQKAAMA